MKTLTTTDLATVTGGIALNTAAAASRPGLQNPAGSWDRWAPKLQTPSLPKPAPTVPLGPFYPDDSKRLIA
ncbi:MAG: bacteriocin [Deltaproteobacteria bacterium]|nr:bacteriocin [Deltaproteobacteria bacterium]